MKNLYFLRHAIAVPHGTQGYPNDDRPLTEEGIEKMKKAAKGIKNIVDKFDLVLTSPLKRANETAILAAHEMGCEDKIEVTKMLLPGCTLKNLMLHLSKYDNKENILLVGHEPDFSSMVSSLIDSSYPTVLFKKGAMCMVEIDNIPPKKPGQLVWLLQPKLLRTLAKK
jgi:phosphohistidine phosphatase